MFDLYRDIVMMHLFVIIIITKHLDFESERYLGFLFYNILQFLLYFFQRMYNVIHISIKNNT